MAIEKFQDKGYNASDIGIIVRDGKEGAMVLKKLIDYSNSTTSINRSRYNYNIVSGDSLLLSNSHVINFIISVLYVLSDSSDMIRRAAMLRFYLLAKGNNEADKIPLISNALITGSGSYFPEGYEPFLENTRQMPLFEAIESIISFFRLGSYSWNVAYLNTFQDYVINFTGNKNSDTLSFLYWWETSGKKKSVVLPGNQDAIRVLTIHKSKGLEFKVVILPFLSWNIDHLPLKQPFLWVKPTVSPFNELGILPVKYGKELIDTVFCDYFKTEKYSVYLDNINLLYVALTRAKDAIYAYSVNNPRSNNSISWILKNAIASYQVVGDTQGLNMTKFYDVENKVFEFGELPENMKQPVDNQNISSPEYKVSMAVGSLKLKLHGENYFSSGQEEMRKKINYGKLMHEVFEGINTSSDIFQAVRKLVFAGKLPAEEAADLEKRVSSLISEPPVKEWFNAGNNVMNEAGIILTSGDIRRPDRVVFMDG
jgi:superfamily I DNA/RNA helicase